MAENKQSEEVGRTEKLEIENKQLSDNINSLNIEIVDLKEQNEKLELLNSDLQSQNKKIGELDEQLVELRRKLFKFADLESEILQLKNENKRLREKTEEMSFNTSNKSCESNHSKDFSYEDDEDKYSWIKAKSKSENICVEREVTVYDATCDDCGRNFKGALGLAMHFNYVKKFGGCKKHLEQKAQPKPKDTKCKYCDNMFVGMLGVSIHLRSCKKNPDNKIKNKNSVIED